MTRTINKPQRIPKTRPKRMWSASEGEKKDL